MQVKLKLYIADISGLFGENQAYPALQRLLALGRHAILHEALPVVLCREFGLQTPPADWPLAALSWLGEGGNPAQAYWLQADPVHLALQRDSFSLAAPVPLPLSRQQAEGLMADLNRHFADDGLQFHLGRSHAGHGGRWYLQLPAAPDLRTCLPQQVMGRDIQPWLPQGRDAAHWRGIVNEIQMLLHEHAINQVRDASGDLAMNSIWLSGGGVLPVVPSALRYQVYSDMPLAIGLARAAGLPCQELPDNIRPLLATAAPAGDALLVLDDLVQAERQWFVPLVGALRSRSISRVDLYFAVRDKVLEVQVNRYDLLKFWRGNKPLASYFPV